MIKPSANLFNDAEKVTVKKLKKINFLVGRFREVSDSKIRPMVE
jgi:hypothetical protein